MTALPIPEGGAGNHRSILVSSCDQGYFPLVKGLFLSLIRALEMARDVDLAFIDLGCDQNAVEWLHTNRVQVVALTSRAIGQFADQRFGYQRAQICRPFLPQLFPEYETIIWVDSDTWFQDATILRSLCIEARRYPDALLICPEVHYTYEKINERPAETREELHACYAALYGKDVADSFSLFPTLNSGFFVMNATNKLWCLWQQEVARIYGELYHSLHPIVLHFAEQLSLNVLARSQGSVRQFDPTFNYLCLWEPPFRDRNGIVRISRPPYHPVGMVHLAGGWKYFGSTYLDRKLLYDSGRYLEANELLALTEKTRGRQFR